MNKNRLNVNQLSSSGQTSFEYQPAEGKLNNLNETERVSNSSVEYDFL